MRPTRAIVCLSLFLLAVCMPAFAAVTEEDKAEWLRTGLTIAGAGTGLAVGVATGLAFSADAIDTPLSSTLLLTVADGAVGAISGALAGYWIAEVALAHQPGPLWSIIEGGGLGMAAGAFVGALTFATNFAIAQQILDVPEGYWGAPPIPILGMALVAGGFWGGFFGAMAGAVALPLISLLMGF